MKFQYLGGCTAGFVQFSRPGSPDVVMHEGEPVDVPDWLAAKLKTNNHFEAVLDEQEQQSAPTSDEPPKRRGGRPRKVTSDASGA